MYAHCVCVLHLVQSLIPSPVAHTLVLALDDADAVAQSSMYDSWTSDDFDAYAAALPSVSADAPRDNSAVGQTNRLTGLASSPSEGKSAAASTVAAGRACRPLAFIDTTTDIKTDVSCVSAAAVEGARYILIKMLRSQAEVFSAHAPSDMARAAAQAAPMALRYIGVRVAEFLPSPASVSAGPQWAGVQMFDQVLRHELQVTQRKLRQLGSAPSQADGKTSGADESLPALSEGHFCLIRVTSISVAIALAYMHCVLKHVWWMCHSRGRCRSWVDVCRRAHSLRSHPLHLLTTTESARPCTRCRRRNPCCYD